MLFRSAGADPLAITQPAHAALSGALLRAWGNDRFAAPAPSEESALGAALHDIGWLDWEAAPTLDPDTGRPHDFRAVDTATHIAIWRRGVRDAGAFGGFPALLVSLHANTIFGAYFDPARATPAEAALVAGFLAEQQGFQAMTAAALARDPRFAAETGAAALTRHRLWLAAVDRLSLELCWGVADAVTIPDVPLAGDARLDLRLQAPHGDPDDLTLAPWPFGAASLTVACQACRLSERFDDAAAMRRALREPARQRVITLRLRPG